MEEKYSKNKGLNKDQKEQNTNIEE